jgi:hypothetical protein
VDLSSYVNFLLIKNIAKHYKERMMCDGSGLLWDDGAGEHAYESGAGSEE